MNQFYLIWIFKSEQTWQRARSLKQDCLSLKMSNQKIIFNRIWRLIWFLVKLLRIKIENIIWLKHSRCIKNNFILVQKGFQLIVLTGLLAVSSRDGHISFHSSSFDDKKDKLNKLHFFHHDSGGIFQSDISSEGCILAVNEKGCLQLFQVNKEYTYQVSVFDLWQM